MLMKKKILLLFAISLVAQWAFSQPKWVDKAKRAVFSIVTYDKDDKMLNTGNGFFVSEDGVAMSDYSLFKGARRAVIINYEGKEMPVDAIMGADDMYDVVKFKVGITEKKVPALALAASAPVVGSEVYLLPYSTQKSRVYTAGKVKAVDKVAENYSYYTLDMKLKDKMVSCPLMTMEGNVFGLAQKASGQDTASICYAVDANYVMAQKIAALSYSDMALKDIGIKKALPETEEEALIFLYMASSQLSPEKYMEVLEDFIRQYPNSSDGYLRRASQRLFASDDEASMKLVVEDLDQALKVAAKKDDVLFSRAKMIYNYVLSHSEKPYDDWSFDKALDEIRQAIAIQPLPVYVQTEGDILYAKTDYAGALQAYEKVNQSELGSAATLFTTAKIKEAMGASPEEVLVVIDSCVARFSKPYTQEAAPYLLERAQALMKVGKARNAMFDYDAYYDAVKGNVNDVFYYYREQAALKARQYQRALDDLAKAIELNPKDLTYRAELAVVNIRVGRNEEAVKILKEALEIDPKYAEAYRLIGIAQIQMKQKAAACESFAKAKELGDPNVDVLIEKNCK